MVMLLDLQDISKTFGPVKALDSVTFSVNKGEIHTILGENGAGKTTLMKIISGNIKPDKGEIIFDGSKINKSNPRIMKEIGVAIVYQELSIFENLTVYENIFPESDFKNKIGLIDKHKMEKEAQKKLKLFDLDIDPEEKVENLPLAEQQIIEILRAISYDPKLLILDEPTSALKKKEVEKLFNIITKLKNSGLSILYISHHLSEVLQISDRITILKDGAYVKTLQRNEVKAEDQLINLMVGRNIENLYGKKKYSLRKDRKIFMKVKNLGKENLFKNINFDLYEREILGIYGLQGSGRLDLMKLIFGLDSFDEGYIEINNNKFKNITPNKAIDNGIVYLNENRKDGGLFFNMTACENIVCPVLENIFKNKLIDREKMNNITRSLIEKFNIKIPDVNSKPKQLSGGNKQKLMAAICFGINPLCLIANEPTRGIDVGAKADIHRFLKDIANEGAGIILISSELPEIISLSDKVLVMKNYKIAGKLIGEQIIEEKIVTLAAGSKNKNKQLE